MTARRVWDTRIGEEANFPAVDGRTSSTWSTAPIAGIVAAVAGSVSPAGPVIAFRDAATGRESRRRQKPSSLLRQPPLFSPDGRTLLVNAFRTGLTVIDTASGRPLRTIELKGGGTYGLAFSPDGLTVAIANGDGHLVEAASGRERHRLAGLPGHPSAMFASARTGRKSRDSQRKARFQDLSDSEDISACLWDAHDGRRLAVLKDSEPNVFGQVNGAVFSPDTRWLVTASSDSTARVWDVAIGRERIVLRGHGGRSTPSLSARRPAGPHGLGRRYRTALGRRQRP